MNTEHTPGPWSYDNSETSDWGWVRDKRGFMIVICSIPVGEDLALHRINKNLLEVLKIIASGGEDQFAWSLTKAELLAREAIAKAEGKA